MGVNPIDNEDLYDAIVLAGVRSPGQVTLSNHKREQKWDIKEPDGSSGGTTTHKGAKIAQFSASFYLVKDPIQGIDDFEEWESFLPLIKSLTDGKDPKAVDIYHPDLASNDITAVSQASIGGMTHDGKGGATIVVDFLEYRPAKKKGGTPKGADAKGKWTEQKKDPNADAKAELEKLLNEAKKAS
jgi:hypothetical protein